MSDVEEIEAPAVVPRTLQSGDKQPIRPLNISACMAQINLSAYKYKSSIARQRFELSITEMNVQIDRFASALQGVLGSIAIPWCPGTLTNYSMTSKAMFTFLWVILIVAHALPVTPVSSQDKNIFLLAGQSNIAGQGGVINGTWDGVVPPECGPNPSVLRLAANLTWVPAAEPLHKDIGGVNTAIGVGPGMSFANSVLARDPSIGLARGKVRLGIFLRW
ncbi:hypothetical protein RHMOL_Rhmol11G0209500 [Rhododendron molle]|uniref:Uncharacterized protein n=1 Tax=Rhododendron molle TaxID=49168 RepID=A0ACC0LU86_RHOML|nr:hypothetical protein RHMOL_Rhmol11G0209500 [Rhododendron molle]